MTPDELAELHAVCFTQPRPWSATEFTDLLAAQQTRLLTSDNGFALVQIAGPEAELLTIAVHPDARRNGEGRNLLDQIMALVKSEGCEDLFLEVVDTNTPAIALYRNAGFTDRAYRKDYYNGAEGTRSSALILHKHL